jgi:hypothetical protein
LSSGLTDWTGTADVDTDTGPGAGREGSAVMMDGTMTVPDHGGKLIVEER